MSPLYIVSAVLHALVIALAFWRGRGWERIAAAVLLTNWGLTELSQFNGIDPPWLIISYDGAVCLFLLYAAIFSGRKWALSAAACQVLLMANHLAFIRYHLIGQWAYVSAYMIWGNLVALALAIGVLTRKHKENSPNF